MPHAVRRSVDLIVGRGLLHAEAIAQELRARLVRALVRRRRTHSPGELMTLARNILAEFEPLLARALLDTDLAAWIAGVQSVAGRLPPWAASDLKRANTAIWQPSSHDIAKNPPNAPTGLLGAQGGDPGPIVRFPVLERAAESLAERSILTRPQFDQLTAAERLKAFTVAYQDSHETLGHIRDALNEAVSEGPSLEVFRQNVIDRLGASPIGPAHIENVFRTNVMSAFSAGHEQIAQNEIVAELFPYQALYATHDTRTRPEHLALETLGLSGTNVYRRDDPMWNYFTPPWDYQCRCSPNLLTIDAAAALGVIEAQEWLRTGRPPANPEWRLEYIPFRPRPGFGARHRVAA